MTSERILEVAVGPESMGERVDQFIAGALDLSRTQVVRLLEDGEVLLEGRSVRKSHRVAPGEAFRVRIPAPEPVEATPEDLPIRVVFEDEHLLVVDKAPGMVVHPAPGHPGGTLVNALLYHVPDLSGIGGALRPGIVHRLDKDTSGLMVVAKGDEAHRSLSEALQRRQVRRRYLAAAWGHLPQEEMTVDAPIGRDPRNRQRMAVVEGGRPAVTHFRVRERWPGAELLDAALETGRTHQIRVHLAHLGHPVVGDDLYGAGWERGIGGRNRVWARFLAKRVSRQFLHARELAFTHPISGDEMRFESPLPADLAAAAEWARTAQP
jgi:23S rRNA pseudouridine1911/1915/1917 synthase